ncbi:MAG: AMP-binding protein [Planctomycetota bacterium]|nr:AMP-binding protein [Planctomycetota bacterium]
MLRSDQPIDNPQCATREAIAARQSERLARLIAEVGTQNRFLNQKLTQAGISPESIRSLADLPRIPFTTKAEILADQLAHPPYGTNLTYPRSAYSRLHQTSGTTGQPMRWLDTPESWNWVLGCWRQLFGWMGLRPDDRLFFPFSFGPFLGFWAGFEGANRLGNLCIAAGGMSSEARLTSLLENEATIVCCTPTYALRLAEVAKSKGIDLVRSTVRALLVAGEPGGNIPATRSQIEREWGATVIDHWGMTELGPLAIECAGLAGSLTVLETECIAEVIDPQSGSAVPPGSEGELVVTTLGRLGSPLVRYRTGDRVRYELPTGEPNACLRLPGGILGRVDEMLTIRGNNFYPSALEDVIRSLSGVAEFRIRLREERAMQQITIEIEPQADLSEVAVDRLLGELEEAVRRRFHFRADIRKVGLGELPRFEMKARRFLREVASSAGGTHPG